MNNVTVKAPGKLMLLGEHAVVYGYPCIVTTVNKYLTVTLSESNENVDIFLTPDVSDQRFLIHTVETFRTKYSVENRVKISTKSELKSYGFGSSAATVIATLKALSRFYNKNLGDQEFFSLGLQIVTSIQGKASGFDLAAALYGGTLYFNGKTKEVIRLDATHIPLLVVYSGTKGNTVSLIAHVEAKRQNYQKGVDAIFGGIEKLVLEAKSAIEGSNWKRLGTMMNYNQNYLEDLGVSTPILNELVRVSLRGNAYGAKLSGAGGGDCVIVLVSPENKKLLEVQLEQAGGEIVPVILGVEGARIL